MAGLSSEERQDDTHQYGNYLPGLFAPEITQSRSPFLFDIKLFFDKNTLRLCANLA